MALSSRPASRTRRRETFAAAASAQQAADFSFGSSGIGLSDRALRSVRSLQDQLKRARARIRAAETNAESAVVTKDEQEALCKVARTRQRESAEMLEHMQVQKIEDLEFQATLANELEVLEEELEEERRFLNDAVSKAEYDELHKELLDVNHQLEEAESENVSLKQWLEDAKAKLAAETQQAEQLGDESRCEQEEASEMLGHPSAAGALPGPGTSSSSRLRKEEAIRRNVAFEPRPVIDQATTRLLEAKHVANEVAAGAIKTQRARDLRRQADRISELSNTNVRLQAEYDRLSAQSIQLEQQLDAARLHNRQLEVQCSRMQGSHKSRSCEMHAELRRCHHQIKLLREVTQVSLEDEWQVSVSSSLAPAIEVTQPACVDSPSSTAAARPWWSAPLTRHANGLDGPCDVSAEVCLSSAASPVDTAVSWQSPQEIISLWSSHAVGAESSATVNAGQQSPGFPAASVGAADGLERPLVLGEEVPRRQQPVPLNLGDLFSTSTAQEVVTQDMVSPSIGSACFSLGPASPGGNLVQSASAPSPSGASSGGGGSPDSASSGYGTASLVLARGDDGGGPSVERINSLPQAGGAGDAAGGGVAEAESHTPAGATAQQGEEEHAAEQPHVGRGQPLLRELDLQVITRNQQLIDAMAERHTG